mgnify:FL=1
MKAFLILEDGTVLTGESFGAAKEVISEVVFNTSMTGYLEILTDPSYAGQSVVMTYPLIGNYGICMEDMESVHPWPKALIVRECPKLARNFRNEMTLDEFLKKYDVPGISGIDAIKKIRETDQEMPILILSAKDREIDKVNGLDSGSDDYMTKPFGVLELQARVRSLLRRHAPKAAPIIESQTLKIDKQTRTVMHNGQVMELTNKEYQLLLYLVENHTRVVERDEILNHIWGYDFIGESRVLDVHIRALRAKLDDDGSKYIKTIRGVGYRYVEEVK